jgi:multicomponent Na+:H+ antiporter subunit E
MVRGALTRVVCFLAFWIIIAGTGTADLIVGALAAIIVSWASLRLLPPASNRVSFAAICMFVPAFLYQSVVAGADVAWRALAPRLRLQPGFVIYPMHLPPGAAQSAFCTVTSLLPGTLPSGCDERGNLIVHCLDESQPIVEQLRNEEELLMKIMGYERGDR